MCGRTANYQPVFDTIQAHTGLRVDDGRLDEAARAVDDVLGSMPSLGVDDLVLALGTSSFTDPLWQEFIQAITVGETYFFRDQGQSDALRMQILPQLMAERQKTGLRRLRLWSAGCASGEEPYSLAMLLHEVVPDIEAWDITILGTDINLAFLERARHGLYRASSFRNETPEYIQKRWFKRTPDGYQLDQTIRDMVVFLPMNLANSSCSIPETLTMNLDLIVCRNVTIYFDQATMRGIVDRLYQALNDMGTLIVGPSELSTSLYRQFTTRTYDRVIFYQKVMASKDKHDTSSVASRCTKSRMPSRPAVAPLSPARPEANPSAPAEESQDLSLEAVWSQAKKAADRERWEEALECLAQVETRHTFRPEFHYLRGLVRMAADNAEEALRAWRQALYCDPMFALAHYSLGELYAHRGETRLAERHWRQAQAAIADLDSQHLLLFADEITVEMLRALLTYRLSMHLGG